MTAPRLKGAAGTGGDAVTSGRSGVTVGRWLSRNGRDLAPLATAAAIVVAAAPINALTTRVDADRFHLAIRWWEPIAWQGTSAIATLLLIPLVGIAVRMWPMPRGRRLVDLGRHVALTVPFSAAHVLAMVQMRRAIYALKGWPYHFAQSNLAGELAYEWRKDCITYLVIAASFALWARRGSPGWPAVGSERIEVRDGTAHFTLDPRQILSVNAEGNYVRVRMDGGSHLIRGALTKWEALTAPHGIRRIHRSALVNVRRVRATRSVNAKDFEVTLDDGSVVRGSRRYKLGEVGPR